MRWTAPLAMLAVVLATGVVGAAPGRGTPPRASATVRPTKAAKPAKPKRHARRMDRSPRALAPAPKPRERAAEGAGWAATLPPVVVTNRNTGAKGEVRLYRDDGTLDEQAVAAFARIASRHDAVTEPLDRRLIQLVVRAAYHFDGAKIDIVSATRTGGRGKHASGEALDFALGGVRARTLAAHLFTYPLAGVGIYTHPKTQYVHLDVRDRGTHWLDGSPPGVTWREKLLADPGQPARDAAYAARMDLPEAAAPETTAPATVATAPTKPKKKGAKKPSKKRATR
jgi:uncharacterized protein YcbK (DUF882 family)